jgi:hypothetical protein
MSENDKLLLVYVITAGATIGTMLAVLWQVIAMRMQLRAQALMRLVDDWRDKELHKDVVCILDLWATWKDRSRDPNEWSRCAREWVEQNNPGKNTDEWKKRRSVSQFISKTGAMIFNGYLRPADVFGVVPEMGRLLAVLYPIEIEIQRQMSDKSRSIADWDKPFPKWEFKALWPMYLKWFRKTGWRLLEFESVPWEKAGIAPFSDDVPTKIPTVDRA